MLHFFKSNNLAVAVVNLLLIVLLRLPYLLHPVDLSDIYCHAEPASMFFIRFCHIGAGTGMIWLLTAGGVLSLIESLLINRIINSHKAAKKNYLGGVIFTLFSGMVPVCLILSPVSVSVLFLLLATDRVFDLARPEKLAGHFFDLGFFGGLAMLFYFPAVYLLPFVYLGAFTMRSVTFREAVMIASGFFSVLLTVFTVYFWYDSLPRMLPDLINIHNHVSLHTLSFTHWQLIALSWTAILSVWILVNVPSLLFSSVIQTRKYINILIIGGALSLLALPLASDPDQSHLLFLFAPLSILYAVYFVETKTNLITEVLFILLLLPVFIFEYCPLFITV